jgi:DNA polymerase-3 subunit gamma/tau
VLSRCQQHEFRRIGVQDIVAQLKRIVEAENLEAEDDALTLMARQATGSLRDAISLLDQMAGGGGVISLEKTHDVLGTATSHAVMDVVDSLIARDPSAGLDRIHAALDGGVDPRQFARQVVSYLRDLLLVRMENASQVDAPHDVRTRMASQASSFTPAELLRVIRAFNEAATERRLSWQPGLPLELAFVDSLELQIVENIQAEGEGEPVARDQSLAAAYEPSVRREEKTSADPLQASSSTRPQPPSQEDQSASSSEGVSLRRVQDRWNAVLSSVRRHNSSTQGLLNSCKVLELKGHDLYLGFASETVKSIMEKPPHVEAAQKSIEEVLGVQLRIRCVIASAGGRIPPEVEDDGMVATAVRLGGKIIDSRELPSRNQ